MQDDSTISKGKKLADFAYATFLFLWACCLMVLWLNMATNNDQCLVQLRGKRVMVADFVNYYQTGYMTLHEKSQRMYDPEVQMYWTNQLIAPMHIDKPQPIQYVPYLFPLMAPLAHWHLKVAYMVWGLVSIVFGAAGLWWLWRLSPFKPALFFCFLSAVLASCPSFITLRSGQFSWFLLGMVSIYAFAFLKKNDCLAGVALALSTIKPQYLPCLAFPALARRRLVILLSAFFIEIGLLGLAGQTIGWHNVLNYPAAVLHADEVYPITPVMMSYRGILSNYLPTSTSLHLSLLILVLGLISALWPFWHHKLRNDMQIDRWLLAVSCLGAVLLSPDTYCYDCLILAVPAVLTLTAISPFTAWSLKPEAFRLWSAIFICMPLISWLMFIVFLDLRDPQYACYIVTLIYTAALACGLRILHQDMKQPATATPQ